MRAEIRRLVASRANGRCEYCQLPELWCPVTFHIDHIVPTVDGGSDDPANLAWSCPACNHHKGRRSTGSERVDSEPIPLFNPRVDHWDDHFVWSEDRMEILALTPTGRITVRVLEVNRSVSRGIRLLLRETGRQSTNLKK